MLKLPAVMVAACSGSDARSLLMSCIETALSSDGRLKASQHEGNVRTAADAGKAPLATADKLNPMSHHLFPWMCYLWLAHQQ